MIRMVLMIVAIWRIMIMIIDSLILSTFGSRNVMIISFLGESLTIFNLIFRFKTAKYMIKIRTSSGSRIWIRIRIKDLDQN